MYNVHTVKFLKVAEARARFGEVLDQAEAGTPVLIERRGVRFRVVVDDAPKRGAAASFAYVDDAVASGQWTWESGRSGVTFKTAKRR